MNYEDDVGGMLGFFSGEFGFYPQFDTLLRQHVRALGAAPREN